MVSAVGKKPFSLSSVAFTNTITRIVCLLVGAGRNGLAPERRTGLPEIDIARHFFHRVRLAWRTTNTQQGWPDPLKMGDRRPPAAQR
jgi:hypothetical protein